MATKGYTNIINNVVIQGVLPAEVEYRYIDNGSPDPLMVGEFRVSVPYEKDGETQGWESFRVEVWNGRAKGLSKLKPGAGSRLIVTGELRSESWKDQEGNARSRVFIRANSVQVTNIKRDDGSEEKPQSAPAAKSAPATESAPAAVEAVDYDSIPF